MSDRFILKIMMIVQSDMIRKHILVEVLLVPNTSDYRVGQVIVVFMPQ
ncbi:hypothetical protein ACIQZI_08250 [Peribacillus sp. NPDC096379]